MEVKGYITYEQFGAIGDGVADDLEAIVKAHDYANAHCLPVKAKDGAVYYIGGKALTATIMTDVDFGGAKFVIDDRKLENIKAYLFSVASEYPTFESNLTTVEAGQKKVDFPHEGTVLLRIFNDEKKNYIRKGINANNGHPQSDIILVDAEGNVLTTVDWSYDKITRQYAKRTDDRPITIKGGTFVTIANQWERVYNYHFRGFSITRSNVTVTGLTHLIEGEGEDGAPYTGFISSTESVNLTVKDCLLTPHKTYQTKDSYPGHINRMGTYDISLNATVGTKLIGIKQTRDILDTRYWGLMGSNFCKDILLEDCDISRFDAHMGVSNGVIRRCRLGHQCLNLIGFGEFLIEDSFALGNAFIGLRSDYGSFFRGNITIRNCTWRPNSPDSSQVISAHNNSDHDFGYVAYMTFSVTIDGLTIEDENANEGVELYVLPTYDSPDNTVKPFPYVPTKKLTYKGIVSAKGRKAQACKYTALYPELEVVEG